MLQEAQLFSLLDRAMNQTAHIRKGEEAVYFCPFCSHYKKKLEINVRTQEWHCWICHSRGTSIRSLFYKLKNNESYTEELYKIIGREWRRSEERDDRPKNLSLPNEFIPLWGKEGMNHGAADYGAAMTYLAERNVSYDDILRYNIGYCDSGTVYKGRIIIPSYDKDGNVNFFSARTCSEEAYAKYVLAPWSKDVVGFELLINWNEPITLVEGSFDAIAVRKNAIPLFGTSMMFALKLAIVTNKVKRVNILLDNDALKQAIDIFDRIEELQTGNIDIHLIRLEDKDPSKLGFERTNEMIEKSKPYGFSDIIKAKLCA